MKTHHYYTIHISFESDPVYRTEWHPTDKDGPFSTLIRGAFPEWGDALEWGRTHLGETEWRICKVVDWNWLDSELGESRASW